MAVGIVHVRGNGKRAEYAGLVSSTQAFGDAYNDNATKPDPRVLR